MRVRSLSLVTIAMLLAGLFPAGVGGVRAASPTLIDPDPNNYTVAVQGGGLLPEHTVCALNLDPQHTAYCSGYPSQYAAYPIQYGYPSNYATYPSKYTGYPGQYAGYPGQYAGYPGQYAGYPTQYATYPSKYTGYPSQYATPATLPDSTIACTTLPANSALKAGIQLSCTAVNTYFTSTTNDGTVSISGGATLVGSATVSGNTISFTVDLNSGPTGSIAVTYVADTTAVTEAHGAVTHYLDTINGSATGITTTTGTFSISSESITLAGLTAMSVWVSSDTLGSDTITVSSASGVAVPVTLSGCSTSSTSSVTSATVASGGSLTVYGLAAGTCSVTGTLRNASNTANTAITTVSAAVNLRSTPTLSPPAGNFALLTVGTSVNLAISPSVTLPTTPALSYAVKTASSTTGLCSLSGSTLTGTLGVISGNTIGTCVVTVTQAANAAYPATTLDITTTFTLLDQPLAGATLTQSPTGSILSPSTYSVSYAGTTYGTLSWTLGGPCTGSSTTASITMTIVTSGTCTATLNAAGTTTYRPAVSATLSTSVTARSNTISFTPSISASAATATLSATANSGLPVTFSSADTAVCTISGSTLTVVADGICDIDADQVGGSGWDPAPRVTASVTFTAASGSISGLTTPTNPGYTTTSVFTPVLTPAAGRTVTLTSSTTGVCTVASFTVTYVSDGSCTLTASAPAVTLTGVRYAPVSATLTYTVAATPRTITGLTTPTNPGYTTTNVFTLAASPTGGAAVTLASSTTGVCTVASSTVTYVADGSCTLTASSAASTVSTTRYAAASATITFTVAATPRTITGLTTPASAGLTTTSVFTLAASPTGGAAVTLASSTTGVCTVSSTTVTYVTGAVGTCTLTASSAASTVSTTRYAATSATLSYTVAINAQVISIPAPTNPGYTTTSVLAPVTSPTGGTVTLTSSTTSVCTVATLTVTYLAEGTCTINATTPARNVTTTRYSADTETISYIVAYTPRAITGLTAPTNPGYTTTSTFTLAVSVTSTKDAAIVLASSTTGVCTVASYTVTYVADGSCTLTASITTTADSTTRLAAASATITFTVAATPRTISGLTTPTNPGYTTTNVFTLAASPTGGAAVTLASSTTGVCSVSSSTVTYVTDGSCTLTASSPASTVSTTRYAAASATITFTVAATPRTITGLTTPTNPGYTTTSVFTLAASPTGGAAVTLASSTTGVCSVSSSTVTYVADGLCTLTASSPASTVTTTRYAAASATISFTVAATPVTISLSLPAGLTPASAPFSANASATPSAGPAISYTSNDTDICTVNSGSGLVTIKISGVCSITASSAAGSVSTTRYAAATATDTSSIALAVQVAPTLTLSASAPYFIAAPLSASVSGGSAKGTLGWTISGACSGTNSNISLNTAGVCSISATYSGDAAYASVTVSREITVAASQTISFPAPVSPGYVGTEATLSASASSGLTVTFSTTSLSVCSISGNTVSYLAEGSCAISANQAGNGSTIGAATSVSRTVTVLPSVQLISASGDASWTNSAGVLGSTATLTATASSGLPVSAASTTTGVCTISTGGSPWTVTFVGLGDCSVRFTRASGTSAGAFYLAAADLILTSGVTGIPAPAVNSPNSLFNFSASNVPGANSRVQMTNPTIVGIGGAYSSPDGTLSIAFGCGAQSNRPLLDAIEFTRILTIDGVAQASVAGTQSCTAKGSYTLSGLSSGSYQISARAVVGSTKSAAVSVGSVIVGAAPVVKIAPIAGSVTGTGLRYLKTTTPTLYWSLVTGQMTGQTLIRYSATPTAEGACPAGAAPGSATAGAGWSPDISFASGTTPATLAASSRDKGFANAALPERCVQFAHVGANGLFSATAWSEIYLVDVTKPSLTPTIAGTLEGAAQTCSTVTVQSCRIEPGVATVSVSASDPAASGVPGSGVMNIRLRGDGFDSGLRPYGNTANRTRSFTAPSDKSSMTLYATITDRAGNSISIPVSFSVASAVDPVFNAVVDLVDCADTSVVIRPDFAEQGFLYWPVGAELCLVPRVDMAVKGLRYVNGIAQESVFIGTLSSKLSGSAASANDTELAQIGKWPNDKIGETFTLGEKPTTLGEAQSMYGAGSTLYEKIAAGTATDAEKALYRSAVLRFRIDAETSIDNADSVPYVSVPFSFTYVYGWVARGTTTPLLDYATPDPVSITLRIIAVNLGAGQ